MNENTNDNLTFRDWNDMLGEGIYAVDSRGNVIGWCPQRYEFGAIAENWVPSIDLSLTLKQPKDIKSWQYKVAARFKEQMQDGRLKSIEAAHNSR